MSYFHVTWPQRAELAGVDADMLAPPATNVVHDDDGYSDYVWALTRLNGMGVLTTEEQHTLIALKHFEDKAAEAIGAHEHLLLGESDEEDDWDDPEEDY